MLRGGATVSYDAAGKMCCAESVPAVSPPRFVWRAGWTAYREDLELAGQVVDSRNSGLAISRGFRACRLLSDSVRPPPALTAANKDEKIMALQTILYDADGELNQIAACRLFPKLVRNCYPSPPARFPRWAFVNARSVAINRANMGATSFSGSAIGCLVSRASASA
jgi:hypothetical protein